MKTENNNYGKQKNYIQGIDGIRAFSVLMVVAYHLKLPFAKGGLLGVTIFFVISGFLITRILLPEIARTKTIDFKNFWIRRLRRLLPAILTMVTALIFVSAIFNRVLFTKTCSDVLSVILGYNNWWQIFNDVSYFENAGAPSPLTHCWSLAIEAQFYLIYPLLLIFLAKFRNRKRNTILITFILALISIVLMWALFDPSKDPSRVYYGTDTRVFSLLIGALLALISEDGKVNSEKTTHYWDVIGVVLFVGLLYMMVMIDGYSSFLYRGGQAIASIMTALIIFSVMSENSIFGRVMGIFPLKWIGDRSYSIYLWHYPIILLISGGKKSSWWIILVEVLLTGVVSAISYQLIETPVRHGIIKKNIDIIKAHPRTRGERRRQIRTIRRSIKTVFVITIIGITAIVCIAFVPREKSLNDIEKLQVQAQKAKKLTEQKTSSTNEKTTNQDASKDATVAYQTDEEILESLNLLLIGDSIALGATDEFYAAFPNSICDAAVSRYTTESFAIYGSYVNEKGWNGDGVIFALGSNGLLYDSLGTLREMLGADRPFFIITARAPYASWEESNNKEIYEFAEATDNTYLIDWYKASEGHSEYFVGDETHLTDEGCKAYIDCIRAAVLQVYKK
ncbi:acyltransferase family protein [Ohessyouella blattaphilus]|uniref:Acyltransferase n=1 Tax=Ohessyouella blattaphilus TaxID=2949333 RepID=A0ABT1EKN4_9FIRM|nr:acyltransferase family protein [Ohessyouella blattaphilus]MCP1109862.1 acyltransferase [Ohessyouella blattaphilus]MCR8563256.1 acyltransferase [Ohessyouella blattaphilus]MDL2251107.1 acyltransferase [Lachnospiraceae bacterium OttesenSCG-928-J05]